MTILSRLDRLLAKHFFGPPIIGLCRLTRHSPNEMAGALLIVASLTISWWFLQPPYSAIFHIVALINVFIAVPVTYLTIFVLKIRYKSDPFWRFALACGLIFVVPEMQAAPIAFNLLLLAAEYAAMIKTLPPTAKKDPSSARSTQVETNLRRCFCEEFSTCRH